MVGKKFIKDGFYLYGITPKCLRGLRKEFGLENIPDLYQALHDQDPIQVYPHNSRSSTIVDCIEKYNYVFTNFYLLRIFYPIPSKISWASEVDKYSTISGLSFRNKKLICRDFFSSLLTLAILSAKIKP